MKQLFFGVAFAFISLYAQQPADAGKIDSIVNSINASGFTKTVVINDTNTILSGMKEKEIIGYLVGSDIKKIVVKFRNSNRIREVYYSSWEKYGSEKVYIKDYDGITLALGAELYIWNRKLLKSIVTDPLNEDEIMKPERIIQRTNYDYFVKYKLEH